MTRVPAGWTETTLGDVLTFQRGFDITRSEQRDGAIPVVSSGGVSSFHDVSVAHGPGVVIGRKGTLGKTFYLDGDFWPHDTTLWVKDFKSSVPRFVYYFMSGFDTTWLDAGSANPTLNRNHLHPLRVLWPPVREQRAIADLLGALDDKIASNRKLAATANALAVLMLGDCEVAPLAELVHHRRSSRMPSESGADRVAHFSLPAFDEGESPEVIDPAEIKSSKFKIEAPSVLISKLNPRFPRVWEIPAVPDIPAYSSTEFLVLEPKCGSTSTLWAALRQAAVARQLESMVAGTSGSHQRVKPADLLGVNVPDVRQLDDRARSNIDGLSSVIHAARRESQDLAALRDALLPRLVSGELRVRAAEKIVEEAQST
ncbi:restriction endonuclease subunit S [Rhodococcus phenolicus]|uniref:restriction endonuclease subunit S n=1 Tax=Rhodococcus phenolicus TaxID=263849 RepID=UPI000831FC94|nr:restriction endonuclease subunit S [Rhodococcus phenolicus]